MAMPAHAAEGAAFLLRLAVHQIVVGLVGGRDVGARHIGDVDALAGLHRLALLVGERARHLVVEAPGPAVVVVDRHPEVAVHRMIGARRDHGEGRHHPLGDAPVVFAFFGVAPGADVEAAGALDHFEHRLHVAHVVLVALRALEQRVAVEFARMQERDVAGVDAAFHRLQPVGLLKPLRHEAVRGRHHGEFPFRQRRLLLGRAHIGPQHAAALDQRIGLQFDLLAVAALARLRWHLDALPGVIVFPAVIRAAQAAMLVAAEPERHAAVGAELVGQRELAVGVAPGEQPLGEKLHAHRRAAGLGQFLGQQGRLPGGAEHLAHRRARAGLRQQVVLFFAEHRSLPNSCGALIAPRGRKTQASNYSIRSGR